MDNGLELAPKLVEYKVNYDLILSALVGKLAE